ncbi:P-loop containing nucleoside triphosphate hydrolase protein [Lipomyces orientalis]|uniref:P-loop containing nucleoside triphosphate hydrolase protein n=1 Tax=Lipomyces orientalis TaxID=1233043 RepID=A0ACC3THV0_9ASCO
MGKYRVRHNDKARAGAIAKQKKLKVSRQARAIRRPEAAENGEDEIGGQASILEQAHEEHDPNAPVLVPMTETEKTAKKAELELLLKPPESKFSKAKKKRLDKYIERQLKREEKKVLLQKLADSKFDTSLLHSLKRLGTKTETRREQLREALLKEKLGILDEETSKLLYEERTTIPELPLSSIPPESEPARPQAASLKRAREEFLPTTSEITEPGPAVRNGIESTTLFASGPGFGFGNLQKRPKMATSLVGSGKKIPYTWRARLEQEKLRKVKVPVMTSDSDYSSAEDLSEDERDENHDDDDDNDNDNEDDDDEEEDAEQYEDEQEEWHGFDEEPSVTKVVAGNDVDDKNLGSVDSDNNASNGVEDGDANGSDGSHAADDDDSGDDEEQVDDGEEEGEDEEDAVEVEEESAAGSRISRGQSFKHWAETQLRGGEAEDLSNINTLPKTLGEYKPVDRPKDRATPPPEIVTIDDSQNRKSYYVHIDRHPHIQAARILLPVVQDEQRIMEAINNNLCVIVCGETGSGKTTQVPQFLYEAGYGDAGSDNPGMIGITQPRRVAAVSMARRVSDEIGPKHKGRVAYQVRFEQNIGEGTTMKFMTDGVLLRELSSDFTLSKYSAIIIDEAHERNVNTDILIGVLSRVLKLRYEMSNEPGSSTKPLKLIIMSATLRISDFVENRTLFEVSPPVLNVESRQYPVSNHFSRRTAAKYLDEVFTKISKIHQRLPPGGILVFLTGQNEITHLCRRLRQAFPKKGRYQNKIMNDESVDVSLRLSGQEASMEAEDVDLGDDVIDVSFDDNVSDDELLGNEVEEGFEEQTDEINSGPLHVLPLYSLLPTAQQLKIFEPPPDGARLCVVATNVAETSLTIPGIRYVVDCGRVKERHYDEETGVQRFDISWISKASADQRAGRAGRTGPGHCYRLYSSAVYESEFNQFSKAEILRMPIESVVLQMKSMGIDTIANFPFPTSPDRNTLETAEKLLHYLGAINNHGRLTDLGRTMSVFPLAPRFAKMLVIGQQFDCLQYIIAIVAGLSVGDPFLSEHELGLESDMLEDENSDNSDDESQLTHGEIEVNKRRRKEYYIVQRKFSGLDASSDVLKLLSVICAYEFEDAKAEFCFNNFLRQKSMEEIHKLRHQLTQIVAVNTPNLSSLQFKTGLGAPSAVQVKALKQMVTSGFIDQVVVRADLVAGYEASLSVSGPRKKKVKVADVPYLRLNQYTFVRDTTLLSGKGGVDKSCIRDHESPVYVHPSSVLLSSDESRNVSEMPPFLVYNIIQQSQNESALQGGRQPRIRVKPLTSITGKQLANLARVL